MKKDNFVKNNRSINLIHGECLEELKKLSDNSVDSCVTDPPAGIGFMGKEWDHNKGGRDNWIEWLSTIMIEVKRVLKPGGYCFVWGLPRTSHWTATALEDAGFEIRDVVTHVFGSGFPKSLNISIAIDKKKGLQKHRSKAFVTAGQGTQLDKDTGGDLQSPNSESMGVKYEGKSEEAKQWEGWGSNLKPASEHWILCRKPLSEKTIADNVLKWGTGGINIDESRIDNSDMKPRCNEFRFPANFMHDGSDEIVEQFTSTRLTFTINRGEHIMWTSNNTENHERGGFDGEGSAARFFYCSKASKKEKNEGLDDCKSTHPTVKPIKLMTYLINMVTPPNGIIIDPFMGSGSTGVAAVQNGYDFIGIEKEKEYFEIAEKRIKYNNENNNSI